MNIHEYQAKEILAAHGLPVGKGRAVFNAGEIAAALAEIPGPPWVIKAQIHAGGRGKGRFVEPSAGEGGGVRIASSHEQAEMHVRQMLDSRLVTHQTGAAGKRVGRVYIEEGCDIASEFYLSLLVDRDSGRIAFVASTEGGMDIEAVAANSPDRVLTFTVDPATGVQPYHGRRVARALGLQGDAAKQCGRLVAGLYRTFVERDCSLLEINPLVLDGGGALLCLDCKLAFDGNALFRQPEARGLRDESEEDLKELEASRHELNYIALDGEIGCMVNGAGLAMATMDIIKLHGGTPANFLDVGGGATKERVAAAFKIVLADRRVRGVLINIFGGIMRCDVIAEGVVAAAREVALDVPLVVRLEGTNVELGKNILAESGLPVVSADDLGDAAAKIVTATRGTT